MSDKPKARGKRRSLVLMERDLNVLKEIYLHRAITSFQLANLCFPDISYETSRKRLRRLQQSGFLGATTSGRIESRGRPALIYYLTNQSAKILEQHWGVSWESVPTGPPHAYHKEHFLRLVDIRLQLETAQREGIIGSLQWQTGKEFWKELSTTTESSSAQADASISFQFNDGRIIDVLLEIDSGNFRQTKHWEPKINAFLETEKPIWVVTGSENRIYTLQKWTEPLLEAHQVGPGKCIFAIYSEIMEFGLFETRWFRTDNSIITTLRPRLEAHH